MAYTATHPPPAHIAVAVAVSVQPKAGVQCWRERGGKILKKKKQNFPDPPVAYTLDLDIESAFKEIKDERAETWIASSASYHLPKFFTETGEREQE